MPSLETMFSVHGSEGVTGLSLVQFIAFVCSVFEASSTDGNAESTGAGQLAAEATVSCEVSPTVNVAGLVATAGECCSCVQAALQGDISFRRQRSAAWLSQGADKLRQEAPRHYFSQISVLGGTSSEDEESGQGLAKVVEEIEKDLYRSLGSALSPVGYSSLQMDLRAVLLALARHKPELGYLQGSPKSLVVD